VSAPSESDAVVRTVRGAETIDTTLVGRRRSGDLVIIHAGAAIAVLEGAET
jgi:hydrogenase maturation factor